MKIKLNVSDSKYKELKHLLEEKGFVIDDDASYILSEKDNYTKYISVKDEKSQKMKLSVENVIYFETYGHHIEVHTMNQTYIMNERLYQLSQQLDPSIFIRVSNSVIISKDKVKSIKPTLSMKFILMMKNGDLVDVTRTYYYIFKEEFNI